MKKMTTFLQGATSKVSSGFKKASMMGTAAMYTAHASLMNVKADTTAADETTGTMDGVMSRILDFIYMIFKYAGILLLVWAIIQIVMAFKNDDADSKQKGMILAVISVVLILIGSLLGPILTEIGFTYVEKQ